jgi:hypothetical protein
MKDTLSMVCNEINYSGVEKKRNMASAEDTHMHLS